MAGQKVKVNCSVEYISFSAHTDFKQTTQFIRALKPAHIILVHGEATEMEKLKKALIGQYEDNTDYNIQVYNPRNTQPVELYFRGEKSAKVIGKLASNTIPKTDTQISGILVKKNFKYHLMSPQDLPNYTDLAISTISQRQSIPYKSQPQLILNSLQKLFGNLKTSAAAEPNIRVRFFDAIDLILETNFIILEWNSSPINDFYADAILSEILKVEIGTSKPDDPSLTSDITMKMFEKSKFEDNLLSALKDMFTCSIEEKEEEFSLNMDKKTVTINLKNHMVKCEEDKQIEQIISTLVNQLKNLST
jgi:cleavage and polyadenylation specificity factor subunit 3